jgi:hypothetical protein
MKNMIKFNSLFFIPLFVLFSRIVQAEIPIWQVGRWHTSGEFVSGSEKRIIDYQVPSDWESLLGQDDPNWGVFPSVLYPCSEKENNPQEISIHFSYPEDYNNPTLIIRAKPSYLDPNIKHSLVVYKGEKELFIGERKIKTPSISLYSFTLGYIKKGLHEKNVIIIKSFGPSDNYISFDLLYFYLDDTDKDGDGVSDADEGKLYKDCNNLVRIPIKSYNPNPLVKKGITLHLEKTEEVSPAFREVRFLDPNLLNFPEWLCPDCYLSYDFLSFKVEGIEPETSLLLQIGFTDALSPSARFYTFQDTNVWEKMAFDFVDTNSASMVLNDGGIGDFDGEINGRIHTTLALLYPQTLGVQIEKKGCFIETVFWRKNVASDF